MSDSAVSAEMTGLENTAPGALRRTLSSIILEIQETYRFRYVVSSFVATTLKQRYRRSVLGFGWSLLGPMLNYGIVGAVFAYTSEGAINNYPLYMFSGAVFFSMLSNGINQAPGIMLNNEQYLKKIYVPKLVFILIAVLVEAINFLLGFVALLILGLAFRMVSFSWTFLALPGLFVLGLMFLIGIGILISILSVFFRDLVHVVPVLMQACFFGTPIVYEMSQLPHKAQKLALLNPFYYFVECFRAPLYRHELPRPFDLGIVAALSIFIFVAGLVTLKKYDNKIVFKL